MQNSKILMQNNNIFYNYRNSGIKGKNNNNNLPLYYISLRQQKNMQHSQTFLKMILTQIITLSRTSIEINPKSKM